MSQFFAVTPRGTEPVLAGELQELGIGRVEEARGGVAFGEGIADAYLAKVFERGRAFDGVVYVAERDGAVVGYVSVWRRYVSDELDDPPDEMGYVSDLVVSAEARGAGVGRALLRYAEESVRAAGVLHPACGPGTTSR